MNITATGIICVTLIVFSSIRAQEQGQQPTKPPRSVWDGVYTEDQAKRGEGLYAADCATCHGATLNGIEMAPPLAGPDFSAAWNGLTVGDLFERIRISMPEDDPTKLSRQQKADVLAFMFKTNRYPAGTVELSHETEVLKQIRVEQKP